ncbi:class I SAM-dependent methyltransferase [Flavobacterium sp. RNTU_13]|uniref:class I SAM-dependent methyltransferase n=1 Tax=Flavobacterium sp. RNTU_13 TaxID=3375145 RepID=UPI003986BBE5
MVVEGFVTALKNHISDNSFVKITLGNYKGEEPALKQVIARPVLIKQRYMLSFTYRYKTKDITKNFEIEEGVRLIGKWLENPDNGFGVANLFSVANTTRIQFTGKKWREDNVVNDPPLAVPQLLHDRNKKRALQEGRKHYLEALGVTDANGKVYKHAQDKYRQINHYIELLAPVLKQIEPNPDKPFSVADMGSGKGYLTFALTDYLTNTLKLPAQVTGVEFREDMVMLCNRIAGDSGMDNLIFVENTIDGYNPEVLPDAIIALHACDTATDDAIAKGINSNAALIVVAPCCHKQIRRAIEKNRVKNEVSFLTRHGIFMERQAEMITDGIRSLILEYFGYKVKVFSFIDDVNTPKNVMITALKQSVPILRKQEILAELQTIKKTFGIDYHYLEHLVSI